MSGTRRRGDVEKAENCRVVRWKDRRCASRKDKTIARSWVGVITGDDPVKCVTCLLGWFRDVLCHVVVDQRVADVFGVRGGRVVVMNVNVTKDEKISRRETVVVK